MTEETVVQRLCASCGRPYEAKRASSRFCGPTCRQRASRALAAGIPPRASTPDDHPVPPSELERATIRELEAAGRLQTAFGQVAVELARRIGSRRETGAAVAALARELGATMTAALAGVADAADPLDEIRARRDLKRHAGRL